MILSFYLREIKISHAWTLCPLRLDFPAADSGHERSSTKFRFTGSVIHAWLPFFHDECCYRENRWMFPRFPGQQYTLSLTRSFTLLASMHLCFRGENCLLLGTVANLSPFVGLRVIISYLLRTMSFHYIDHMEVTHMQSCISWHVCSLPARCVCPCSPSLCGLVRYS